MGPHTDIDLVSRRAIEALRSGVPNRDAVKILGCNQPQAEERFDKMLALATDVDNPPGDALGMLVTGGFGTGKSHLLTYLEDKALSEGFVCSRVTISKETPLYDLGKVFKSAVENGQVPGRRGQMMEELGQVMEKSQRYPGFFAWANGAASDGLLNQIFPATLSVHEYSRDLELNTELERFWGGDRIKVKTVKDGLRQIGQLLNYTFRAPKAADLPPQRLRFVTELIKGAGYNGWVVLLDEIELVSHYTLLQRGRSYAELARWMGQTFSEVYPGLVVVGAVTDDFASAVISPDGQKKDEDNIVHKMVSTARYRAIAPQAKTGMQLLVGECQPLGAPSDDDVRDVLEMLRQIYTEAYSWPAQSTQIKTSGVGYERTMRYKVRAAVNEWDLLRLYPGFRPEPVSTEFLHNYEEDSALEGDPKDDDASTDAR